MADSKVGSSEAQRLALGLGLRRGTPAAVIERVLLGLLSAHGLALDGVVAVATVDRKRNEPGLLALARARRWPLTFYSAEELAAAARTHASERVRSLVGTPAVAEPAALLCARAEQLLLPKTVCCDKHTNARLTVAIARFAEAQR